jgi:hypothetical protein
MDCTHRVGRFADPGDGQIDGAGGARDQRGRMEKDGLLRRKLNRQDRRRFDVSLSRKGQEKFENVWPAHEEGIGRYFVNPLTGPDIEQLSRVLATLIEAHKHSKED